MGSKMNVGTDESFLNQEINENAGGQNKCRR